MARRSHTLGPFVAYHGCDSSVAEAVLADRMELLPSVNDYDWLGSGIYFWLDSPERGLEWARHTAILKNSSIKNPAVIGALIYPGLCLNLTDYGVMPKLLESYEVLKQSLEGSGLPIPRNTLPADGILLHRALDCAVLTMTHQLRADARESPYDTVYGVFEEGKDLYPGAGFRVKTHVQIAVRNPDSIIGYFRVRGLYRSQ